MTPRLSSGCGGCTGAVDGSQAQFAGEDYAGQGEGERQAAGVTITAMNRKNATPSAATGIPRICDSGLVVTASQFTTLLAEQNSIAGEV
jgi:hypothetical protein